MKLNRNQIIGGLAGLILASTGFISLCKGLKYDVSSRKYETTNNKIYELYQKKKLVYGLPGVIGLIIGLSITGAYLTEDSNNKPKK